MPSPPSRTEDQFAINSPQSSPSSAHSSVSLSAMPSSSNQFSSSRKNSSYNNNGANVISHLESERICNVYSTNLSQEVKEKQYAFMHRILEASQLDSTSDASQDHKQYIDKLAQMRKGSDSERSFEINLTPPMEYEEESFMSAAARGRDGADGTNLESIPPEGEIQMGQDGLPGQKGAIAEDGKIGRSGDRAADIFLRVSGTLNELHLTVALYPEAADEKESPHAEKIVLKDPVSILVNGRGATGQKGGNAQDGANGGNGGMGGWPAGSGGRGAPGRRAGNGGAGGNGGDSARVFVEYTDAKLLTLFTFDLRPGSGADGGKPGRPGKGGKGGPPASAPPGYPAGKPGADGPDAPPSKPGERGEDGKYGAIFFRSTEKQEEGPRLFNVKVTEYSVRGVPRDDQIIEPGETIEITEINILNDGSLTVPSNAQIQVLGSPGIFSITDSADYTLHQEIAPGSDIVLRDVSIRGCIQEAIIEKKPFDIVPRRTVSDWEEVFGPTAASTPRPSNASVGTDTKSRHRRNSGAPADSEAYLQLARLNNQNEKREEHWRFGGQFQLRTEVSFPDTEFRFPDSQLSKILRVQYPVRLERLDCPAAAVPGSSCTVSFDIHNISNMSYGSASTSGIPIEYSIEFDEKHLLPDNIQRSEEKKKRIIRGTIDNVAALSSQTVSVPITIDPQSEDALFSLTNWTVRLYYNDRFIEKASASIRICPEYEYADSEASPQSDVLLISNKFVSRTEYVLYERLFSSLGLKFSVYDEDLYKSDASVTWKHKFRGKVVVCPLGSEEQLRELDAAAIVDHFSYLDDHADKLESGFVLVGGNPKQDVESLLYEHSRVTDILSEKNFSDNFPINEPSREDMQKRCKTIEKENEEKTPSHRWKVFVQEYNPYKLSRSWLNPLPTYCYGKATLKRFPLNRLHRFLLVTSRRESQSVEPDFLSSEAGIADSLSEAVHTTDSKWFQVLLSVICALSIEKKLEILRSNCPAMQWNFEHSEFHNFTTRDLIGAALYDDLKREFFKDDQELNRCRKIFDLMENRPDEFFVEPVIYGMWYALSRLHSFTLFRSVAWSKRRNKRSGLKEMKDKFGEFLESLPNQLNGNLTEQDVSIIKAQAKEASARKDRLKIPALQTDSVYLNE